MAINVSYVDETENLIQKDIFDFEARVFSHEYDLLEGIPFLHWRVNEGDIKIKDEFKEDFENLDLTIDYYKNRLRDARISAPEIFETFSLPLINVDKTDFEEHFLVQEELRNKQKLTFEDIMLIDIEKAIRKDLKLKLKKETSKQINH